MILVVFFWILIDNFKKLYFVFLLNFFKFLVGKLLLLVELYLVVYSYMVILNFIDGNVIIFGWFVSEVDRNILFGKIFKNNIKRIKGSM